jgi:hypothetical protein
MSVERGKKKNRENVCRIKLIERCEDKEIVRKNLSEVFNSNIDFTSEINENIDISLLQNSRGGDENEVINNKEETVNKDKSEGGNGKMLSNLLNTFGGEVVS